jgi:hypothetical protein
MKKTLYEAEDEFITIDNDEQSNIQTNYIENLGLSFLVDATTSGLNDLMKVSLDSVFNPDKIDLKKALDDFSQTFVYYKTLLQYHGLTNDIIDNQIGIVYFKLREQMKEFKKSIESQNNENPIEDVDISDIGLDADVASNIDNDHLDDANENNIVTDFDSKERGENQ